MITRNLTAKAAGIAAVAGCVLVAVVALGFAVYAALSMVTPPAVAAALTALAFAVTAGLTAWLLNRPREAEVEDEPAGLPDRVMGLFQTRPILGAVAGLAAGWIFLRNPALATMVAAAFTEKARGPGRPRR